MIFNLNFEYVGLIYVLVTLCLVVSKHFEWTGRVNDFFQYNNLLIGIFSLIGLLLFFLEFCSVDFDEYLDFHQRAFGYSYPVSIIIMFISMVVPLIFLIKSIRTSYRTTVIVSLLILLPIFYEQYLVYFITDMNNDYLASSWSYSFSLRELLSSTGIYSIS